MKTPMGIAVHKRVFRIGVKILAASIALAYLSGCASFEASLPSITQAKSNEQLVGKMVWFDLVTPDPEKVTPFYEKLFGWGFSAYQDDYSLIEHKGTPIGGLAVISGQDPDIEDSQWLSNLSVEDVESSVKFISENGGKIIEPTSDVPVRGKMAVVKDPLDAFLVLLKAEGGDPPDNDLDVGKWVWADFFATDVEKALDVYKKLAGYEIIPEGPENNETHYILKKDGKARGAVVKMPFTGIEASWVPYVGVESLDRAIEDCKQSGGSLMIREGDAAILLDPAGAAIGIKEGVAVKGEKS